MYKVQIFNYENPQELIQKITENFSQYDKLLLAANEEKDELIIIAGAKPGEDIRKSDMIEAEVIVNALNIIPK